MSVMGEITLIANRNLQIQHSNTPILHTSIYLALGSFPPSDARDRVPVLQCGADVPGGGNVKEGKVNITIKLGWTGDRRTGDYPLTGRRQLRGFLF